MSKSKPISKTKPAKKLSGRDVTIIAVLLCYLGLFSIYPKPVSNQNGSQHPAAQTESAEESNTSAIGTLHVLPWIQFLIADDIWSEWTDASSLRTGFVDRAMPIIGLCFTLLVGYSIGFLVLRAMCRATDFSRWESTVISTGIGLGVWTLYIFLIGVIGLYQHMWVFLVPGLVIVGYTTYLQIKSLSEDPKSPDEDAAEQPVKSGKSQQERWVYRHLCWLLPAIYIVLASLVPPIEFDVTEYHLQVPKEWYQSGGMVQLPHNIYSNMPMGAELLSIPTMSLMPHYPNTPDWWQGAISGKAIIGFYLILTAALTCVIGRRWFGLNAGMASLILLVCTPTLVSISTDGLVEMVLAFYLLLTVYFLLRWDEEPIRKWVILAGSAAGMALSIKYTAVVFVWIPAVAFLAIKRRGFKPVLAFAIGVLIFSAPWLVRNLAWTSNPVYPLAGSIFETEGRTDEHVAQWNNAHKVPEFSIGNFQTDFGKFFITEQGQSPFLIPLALIAIAIGYRHRVIRPIFWWTVFYLVVWWCFTHRLSRFWAPIVPLVAVMAGYALQDAFSKRLKVAFNIVLVLAAIYGTSFISRSFGTYNRVFVDYDKLTYIEPISEARDNTIPIRAHRYMNREIPRIGDDQSMSVLLVGDATPFELTMPAYYNTCFDECLFDKLVKQQSLEDAYNSLLERNIYYVYVDFDELARYRSPSNYGTRSTVTREDILKYVRLGLLEEMVDAAINRDRGMVMIVKKPSQIQ